MNRHFSHLALDICWWLTVVKPDEQTPAGWLNSFPRNNIWQRWSTEWWKDFKSRHIVTNIEVNKVATEIDHNNKTKMEKWRKQTLFFTTLPCSSFCCRMGLREGKPPESLCSTRCSPSSYFTSKWMGVKISRMSFCTHEGKNI